MSTTTTATTSGISSILNSLLPEFTALGGFTGIVATATSVYKQIAATETGVVYIGISIAIALVGIVLLQLKGDIAKPALTAAASVLPAAESVSPAAAVAIEKAVAAGVAVALANQTAAAAPAAAAAPTATAS